MAERRWLVIMLKQARAGAVKSRLARAVGTVEATRFYRAASADLLRRLGRDPRWRTVLSVTPDSAVLDATWPRRLDRIPQGSGDLGTRMQRIMDRLPPGPALIVGSDVPGVSPEHISRAFRLLGTHDAVFGPAEDGGYWLVGLRRRPRVPRAFAAVRWSSPHALADTLRNLDGLSVGFVGTLYDVDEAADWRRWRRSG
jgi:rSAM/selenodomain-associated transferase 1